MAEGLSHRGDLPRYISPAEADRLMKDLPPAAKNIQASCLVIRRSGIFGAFNNPLEEMLGLNAFFKDSEPILHRYGGFIEDINSQDATKVDFGISSFQPDHGLRAVCAALGLRDVLKEFTEINSNISIGIGINSGDVACGNVGSPTRLDYGIWGDNVRITSILADHAASVRHDIVIGEGTWQQLPQDVFVVGEQEQIVVQQDKMIIARRLEGFAPGIDPALITEPLTKSASLII